jgi:aspartyl-tRNA(Asn)/glutamyl-tRNA(Gln) amidotransferase subunit A
MNSNIFSFSEESAVGERQNCLRVAIQPNMSCQRWPANAGSMALENYVALEDATAIRLLKQTGAKIVGSTHMSELGFGLVKDTGSRAVSENLADLALITDNMGEVRIAAARECLPGFKPSYGIISRSGLIGLIPSMECWGILARKVSDIQSAMTAISVRDDQDFSMTNDDLPDFSKSRSFNKTLRVIGVAEGYENNLTKAESTAWKTALSALEKSGFQIEKIKQKDFALFSLVHNIIGAVEASSSAGKYDGVRYGHRTSNAGNWNEMYLKSRGESFGTLIKAYLFQGAYFQFQNYTAFENACRVRGRLLDEVGELFTKVDWMASLTIRENRDASKATGIEDIYEAFSFTAPASVTGLPALQIPGIALYGNMDFGLQITGCPLSDPELLDLGAYLEATKKGGPAK